MEKILSVNNASKSYGTHTLWENVDFHINTGEIVGLVGNNGTGKTTLMKAILGLTTLSKGSIEYQGTAEYLNNNEFRNSLGYLLETPLYGYLNAYETIKLMNIFEGQKMTDEEIDGLLQTTRLVNDRKKVKKYSFGMQQKLRLAIALMRERKLLILDEPTVGLDPQSVEEFLDIVRTMVHKNGTSILLSSHQLDTIAPICNRYLYISEQQIREARKIYFRNGDFYGSDSSPSDSPINPR